MYNILYIWWIEIQKRQRCTASIAAFIPTRLPRIQDSVFRTVPTSVILLNGFFNVYFCSLVSGPSYSAVWDACLPLSGWLSHTVQVWLRGHASSSMLWQCLSKVLSVCSSLFSKEFSCLMFACTITLCLLSNDESWRIHCQEVWWNPFLEKKRADWERPPIV